MTIAVSILHHGHRRSGALRNEIKRRFIIDTAY